MNNEEVDRYIRHWEEDGWNREEWEKAMQQSADVLVRMAKKLEPIIARQREAHERLFTYGPVVVEGTVTQEQAPPPGASPTQEA